MQSPEPIRPARGLLVPFCVMIVILLGVWIRGAVLRDSPVALPAEEWPAPLVKLAEASPGMAGSTQVIGVQRFVDLVSLWLVEHQSAAIENFIVEHKLEPVSNRHPKLPLLMTTIPDNWPQPKISACQVFASPGYGSVHQEGDLFLVVTDGQKQHSYVLHERIF